MIPQDYADALPNGCKILYYMKVSWEEVRAASGTWGSSRFKVISPVGPGTVAQRIRATPAAHVGFGRRLSRDRRLTPHSQSLEKTHAEQRLAPLSKLRILARRTFLTGLKRHIGIKTSRRKNSTDKNSWLLLNTLGVLYCLYATFNLRTAFVIAQIFTLLLDASI